MRVLITNCPNCGAPLKDGKCLYCDTHVRLANEVDVDFNGKPVELMLRIKNGDSIILLPLVGRINSIETRNEYADYYNNGFRALSVVTAREVEFTFSGFIQEVV
jgi:uncharacterized Zn finger protein (UPF0148 family)